MLRRAWLIAPVAGLVVVVLAVQLIRHNGDTPAHQEVDTKPVLVGSITLDTAQPKPGAAVIATISLTADRPLRVDALVLAVRDAQGRSADSAGRSFDFPDAGPIELDTTERTVTVAHQFQENGTYVYFLRYRHDGSWQDLPPYDAFTVG